MGGFFKHLTSFKNIFTYIDHWGKIRATMLEFHVTEDPF